MWLESARASTPEVVAVVILECCVLLAVSGGRGYKLVVGWMKAREAVRDKVGRVRNSQSGRDF